MQGLQLVGCSSLFFGPSIVRSDLLCNFAEVTRPFRWNDKEFLARLLGGRIRKSKRGVCSLRQASHERREELIRPRIIELRCNGADDRQCIVLGLPEIVVTLELFPHVADRIEGAALVKLIDGNNIGEVEHIDFLQLRCCAKFRGHDIQRNITVVHDFSVTLSDSACLEDDEVKPAGSEDIQSLRNMFGQGEIGLARCE